MGVKTLHTDFLDLFLSDTLPPGYCRAVRKGKTGTLWEEKAPEGSPAAENLLQLKDVPDYVTLQNGAGINVRTARMYPGFLINLEPYEDMDAYLQSHFSGKRRAAFRTYRQRLEGCFNIRYAMFYGDMPRETYDRLFNTLRAMIQRRFLEKEAENDELGRMDQYQQQLYARILEKKACCHVIYDGDTPISISFNLLANGVFFGLIKSYDTDYSKFYPGFTDLLLQIDWCFAHRFKTVDLLKGDLGYKRLFSNEVYAYKTYFLYPAGNLTAQIEAFAKGVWTGCYYRLLAQARKWQLHQVYRWLKKFRYRLQKSGLPPTEEAWRLREVPMGSVPEGPDAIPLAHPKQASLRRKVYNWLYGSREALKDIRVFEINKGREYLIRGRKKAALLYLNAFERT